MRRRNLLAGAAAAGLASRAAAQQPMPRIAYLSGRSRATDSHLLEDFRAGLKSAGYLDGQNVTLDIHWADGRYDQVARMATELVATRPNLIAAVGGTPVVLAAKAATSTIPVVFGAGADPTSRPRRPSASTCRPRCSPAPTR